MIDTMILTPGQHNDAPQGNVPNLSEESQGQSPRPLVIDTSDVAEACRRIRAHLVELQTAKQKIDAQKLALERKIQMASSALAALQALDDESPVLLDPPARSSSDKRKKYQSGSIPHRIVTQTKKVLLQVGRPMRRGELLDQLVEGGLEIRASDPERYLSRMLREDPDFVHIEKMGYWLADMPYTAPA